MKIFLPQSIVTELKKIKIGTNHKSKFKEGKADFYASSLWLILKHQYNTEFNSGWIDLDWYDITPLYKKSEDIKFFADLFWNHQIIERKGNIIVDQNEKPIEKHKYRVKLKYAVEPQVEYILTTKGIIERILNYKRKNPYKVRSDNAIRNYGPNKSMTKSEYGDYLENNSFRRSYSGSNTIRFNPITFIEWLMDDDKERQVNE